VPSIELISSNRCPFVQRSIVVLEHKQVPYTLTFVDPYDAPEWFKALSPLGKVPVLRIDGEHVLFESAVINEYLDEISPGSMYPDEPLARAQHRAWIAFGSDALSATFRLLVAEDQAGFEDAISVINHALMRITAQMADGGPFFSGSALGLVDAAYAPLFIRLEAYERLIGLNVLKDHPRIQRWSDALLQEASVKAAVFEGLDQRFIELMTSRDGFAASRLATSI
jgi:glutathione S-transferase